MSILTYNQLKDLPKLGIITNVKEEQIQGIEIDVTLSNDFYVESLRQEKIDLIKGETPRLKKSSELNKISLQPQQFVLASIQQELCLPKNLKATFTLSSTLARCGLQHMLSIDAVPGFKGTLTLELFNSLRHHTLVLSEGMKIGNLKFTQITDDIPDHKLYFSTGKYCGQTKTKLSRGL